MLPKRATIRIENVRGAPIEVVDRVAAWLQAAPSRHHHFVRAVQAKQPRVISNLFVLCQQLAAATAVVILRSVRQTNKV